MIEHLTHLHFEDGIAHAEVRLLDGKCGHLRIARNTLGHLTGQLHVGAREQSLNSIQIHQIMKGITSWDGHTFDKEDPFFTLLSLRLPKHLDLWLYSQCPQSNAHVHLVYEGLNIIQWTVSSDTGVTVFKTGHYEHGEILHREESLWVDTNHFARCAYGLRHYQDLMLHYTKEHLHVDELEEIVSFWNTHTYEERSAFLQCRQDIDLHYPFSGSLYAETPLWLG